MQLKPNMTLEEANTHLQDLYNVVDNDIKLLHCTPGGAPFSVAREILCMVDHLGALAGGRCDDRKTSTMAKSFIIDYLGQIDGAYTQWGPAMYEMYRHGTVHNFAPQPLTNGKEVLGWAFLKKEHANQHLRLGSEISQPTTPGSDHLMISAVRLVEDLKKAIQLFRKKLQAEPNLLTNFNNYAAFVTTPKPMTSDWKKPQPKKRKKP